MKHYRGFQKAVVYLLLAAFGFVSLIVAPAQAAMVGTPAILEAQSSDAARHKVKGFLDRQEVARQLQAWGVDADEAKNRVDTMTDQEVAMLSAKIDQVPAGGDALGFVLAVAFLTFVTLIILDIAGVTDVFTFINKR
ncbi:MAG: hypothetical protein VR64_13455 [Desulfatitalea sp. BRH_c12]|nr:MAG: hypothetical protein VR64_13455 [Desulfatitalea sp. BRH_c12]